jgi:hypothetical protein
MTTPEIKEFVPSHIKNNAFNLASNADSDICSAIDRRAMDLIIRETHNDKWFGFVFEVEVVEGGGCKYANHEGWSEKQITLSANWHIVKVAINRKDNSLTRVMREVIKSY